MKYYRVERNRDNFDYLATEDLTSSSHIDISANQLRDLSRVQFKKLCSYFSSPLDTLDLGSNELGQAKLENFALNCLPKVRNLGLSGNELSDKPAEKVAKFLQTVSPEVESVDLSVNQFNKYTMEELIAIISALPKTVTKLNLSGNNFASMSTEELVEFLNKIPEHILELDLCWNNFERKSRKEQLSILAAVPATVRALKASIKIEDQAEDSHFLSVLAAELQERLVLLVIDWPNLRETPVEQVRSMLSPLASKVELSFSSRNLGPARQAQLEKIAESLPDATEFFYLDCNERVEPAQVWAELLSQKLREMISKEGVSGICFESIVVPKVIDSNLLEKLIKHYEKEKDGLSSLICGLLLQAKIRAVEFNNNEPEAVEKRAHDALSFYIKAGNVDPNLRSVVEFLVWELKVTTDFSSVKERINQAHWTPSESYFPSYSFFSHEESVPVVSIDGFRFGMNG
ncbi:hypothetical protein [Legionella sp.]|uniref:hypothetical protein n=1 Tax=Legionella sp. TaxID=459 RepID=UPI000CAAB090|nr:hypothetical protein [Legionella sp.]PJE11476.1 MAG: hypothetical protein CK430_08730 [Legionella sp.]